MPGTHDWRISFCSEAAAAMQHLLCPLQGPNTCAIILDLRPCFNPLRFLPHSPSSPGLLGQLTLHERHRANARWCWPHEIVLGQGAGMSLGKINTVSSPATLWNACRLVVKPYTGRKDSDRMHAPITLRIVRSCFCHWQCFMWSLFAILEFLTASSAHMLRDDSCEGAAQHAHGRNIYCMDGKLTATQMAMPYHPVKA